MLQTIESPAVSVFLQQGQTLHPQDKQRLDSIQQWCAALEGVEVVWEVWFYPFSVTQPLLSHHMVLKDVYLEGTVLRWCQADSSECFSVHFKQLVLDQSVQELDIVPENQHFDLASEPSYRLRIVH